MNASNERNGNEGSFKSSSENSNANTQKLLYFGAATLVVLLALVILFLVFKRLYHKFRRGRRGSSIKLKKADVKSMYDDKFIIGNEGENIRDKSMIKEFLENNGDLKKKDESLFKKEDKNFSYICAKNVFNIEGEESEYHYDSKRGSNRKNSNDSAENEEESGQFSQDLEQSNELNEENIKKNENENSILNVMN